MELRTADKGFTPAWSLGKGLTFPHPKKIKVTKYYTPCIGEYYWVKNKENEIGRHVTRTGEKINSYMILVEGEGKKLLGSSRRRWKCNIRMDPK